MNKMRMLTLGFIVFQSMNMLGLQNSAFADSPHRQQSQATVAENSMVALAQVLHKWSGHRSYENLVVALGEEVNKHGSIDPLITTAARMIQLATALNRLDLYQEAASVMIALKPDIGSHLRNNQQLFWRIDKSASRQTIYDRLEAKQSNKEIFEALIFNSELALDGNFTDVELRRHELDLNDERIQSSEDYIVDALYGSFDDDFGGASESRNNPLVQKILAGRDAESISAEGQYVRDIINDAVAGSAVGGFFGGAAGLCVGGPAGMGAGAGLGGLGGFAIGAVAGAISRHDDYKKAKEAETQAAQQKANQEQAQQKKNEQERVEKQDRERKEKARKDEEEVNRLELAQQTTNTAKGVNPDRAEGSGSGFLRMIELLQSFHKLINVREDIESNHSLLTMTIEKPNSGSADPSRHDFENGRGSSKLKMDHVDITNPGNDQLATGGSR